MVGQRGETGLVHRRTFHNTNQVVELTIRTIPKDPPRPPPPPPAPSHPVPRQCRLSDPNPKKSKVTVEVRQKKSGHSRTRDEDRDINTSSSSSSSSSFSSSSISRRKERKKLEVCDIKASAPPPAASSSSSPPPSPPPLIPSNNSRLHKPPHSSSHAPHLPYSSSQPPPVTPSDPVLQPPSAVQTHPQQQAGGRGHLSDTTTPSPFGESALLHLRHLKAMLQARGLEDEGAALVGVLEAVITGSGSGSRLGDEPLPHFFPTTTTNNNKNNSSSNITDGEIPPQISEQHKKEISQLKEKVSDKEKLIEELRSLSSQLVQELEQIKKKQMEEKEEREAERKRESEGEEEEEEESKKLRQENKKMREKIVNLEIQLTRTRRLLELERQRSSQSSTTTTTQHPTLYHRNARVNPTHSIPFTATYNPTSARKHSHNIHTDQSGTTNGVSVNTGQSQRQYPHPRDHATLHSSQVVVEAHTPPQKLPNKPQSYPGRPSGTESEADSAYEKTPSQVTSKTSTPLSSVRPDCAHVSSRPGVDCQGSGKVEERGGKVLGGGSDSGGSSGKVEEKVLSRKGNDATSLEVVREVSGYKRGSRDSMARGNGECDVMIAPSPLLLPPHITTTINDPTPHMATICDPPPFTTADTPLPHLTTVTTSNLPHITINTPSPPHTTTTTTFASFPSHTTSRHFPPHITMPPPPRLESSTDTSLQKLQLLTRRKKQKRKKPTPRTGLYQVKVADDIRQCISQDSINLSSPSSLGEHDCDLNNISKLTNVVLESNLTSSKVTQESSFVRGIVGVQKNAITPRNSPARQSHGTRVMESTRVSGVNSEGSKTRFVEVEGAEPSREEWTRSVDLLE